MLWVKENIQEVINKLNTDTEKGLASGEVENRLNKYGLNEFEENLKQIDIINEKQSKFIFKLFNQSKIKKLNILCTKQKQEIAQIDNILNTKKEEMRNLSDALLKSFD